MKKYILMTTVAGLALGATAFTLTPGVKKSSTGSLQARVAEMPAGMSVMDNADVNATAPRRAVTVDETADVEISVYGTPTEVLYEDFELCTRGKFGNPATIYKTWNSNVEIPWTNMKAGYTATEGWGSWDCFSAGGMMALVSDDQAHINTPMLDVSAEDVSVVEFRAYAVPFEEEGTEVEEEYRRKATLAVEAAETRNMGPTWDICDGGGFVFLPTGSWQDVRVYFRGGGKTTLYNIVLMEKGTVYIDDIRVSTIHPYVGVPHVKNHGDYKGTSFICRWDAVEDAEKYLVNVYKEDEHMEKGEAVVTDAEVTGTEYLFDQAVSGTPYWYDVRAVKGEHISYVSASKYVWQLEAPVMEKAEVLSGSKYKASWGEVPVGEVYSYKAYATRTAEEDGEFVITKANFDNLVDHDGKRTGWTRENNDGQSYDEYRVQGGVVQAGWTGKHSAPFDDCLAIDGWWYLIGREDAGLLSPEFDLSANGGKATLELTLRSEFSSGETNGYEQDLYSNAAVAVFAWNDAKEDFDQVNLYYPSKSLTLDWSKQTFQLEGLTSRCVIGIYCVGAPDYLYIKDLKLTQERKAGDKFTEPCIFERYLTDKSLEVTIDPYYANCDITHHVNATGARLLGEMYGEKQYAFVEGRWSEPEFVMTRDSSAVREVSASADVKVMGGVVSVSADAVVYDIAGRKVAELKSGTSCQLPARGVYLVSTASQTVKINW